MEDIALFCSRLLERNNPLITLCQILFIGSLPDRLRQDRNSLKTCFTYPTNIHVNQTSVTSERDFTCCSCSLSCSVWCTNTISRCAVMRTLSLRASSSSSIRSPRSITSCYGNKTNKTSHAPQKMLTQNVHKTNIQQIYTNVLFSSTGKLHNKNKHFYYQHHHNTCTE